MNSQDEKTNQEELNKLVELVGQDSCIGKRETKEAVSLCLEIGSSAYIALADMMVKDIITRLDSENSQRSFNAAVVLGKAGKTSIPALSSAVRISSYAHLALGILASSVRDRAAKKEAVNILNNELLSSDWMRVEAAIKGFGNSKYKRIVPILKKMQSSTSNYDIKRACDEAIVNLSPLSQIFYILTGK